MAAPFLAFEPSQHQIIDLSPFESNNYFFFTPQSQNFEAEIESHLRARGWCIVKLPKRLTELAPLLQPLERFFSAPQELKQRCHIPPQFGYSAVDHKEGIRFLSGKFPSAAPKDLASAANGVCQILDNVSMQITSSLGTLLGLSQTAIALKADLPVAYTGQIGMFDIALYSNNRAGQPPPAEGESVDDVNCVPHYDPGLFSISIFSNHEGLQLYDPLSNTWCAAPVNTIQGQQEFGVLWLGKAAADVSQGRWKAGVHRVIYPAISGPRLTMWYEMCTVAQVNGPDDSLPMPQGEVELPNVTGYGKMLYVSPGETQSDVLRRIERRRGLPMSKVPRFADKFKSRENVPGFAPIPGYSAIDLPGLTPENGLSASAFAGTFGFGSSAPPERQPPGLLQYDPFAAPPTAFPSPSQPAAGNSLSNNANLPPFFAATPSSHKSDGGPPGRATSDNNSNYMPNNAGGPPRRPPSNTNSNYTPNNY